MSKVIISNYVHGFITKETTENIYALKTSNKNKRCMTLSYKIMNE